MHLLQRHMVGAGSDLQYVIPSATHSTQITSKSCAQWLIVLEMYAHVNQYPASDPDVQEGKRTHSLLLAAFIEVDFCTAWYSVLLLLHNAAEFQQLCTLFVWCNCRVSMYFG